MTGRQIREEVRLTQMAVLHAGVPAPYLLRPPYGEFDLFANSQTPMAVVRWNIDPEDWKQTDPRVIVDRVISRARPGCIILLHDINAATAAALDPIIQNLKTRFKLVTISQMFNMQPGQRGEFFGR
jgi:peptidoglycan/xylan/chitin deacetylase (PgdA/CDA1 family)